VKLNLFLPCWANVPKVGDAAVLCCAKLPNDGALAVADPPNIPPELAEVPGVTAGGAGTPACCCCCCEVPKKDQMHKWHYYTQRASTYIESQGKKLVKLNKAFFS